MRYLSDSWCIDTCCFFNLMQWLSFQKKQQMTGWQHTTQAGNPLFLPQKQPNSHNAHKKRDLNWYDDFFWLPYSSLQTGEKPLFCGRGETLHDETRNRRRPTPCATLTYPCSKPPPHSARLKPQRSVFSCFFQRVNMTMTGPCLIQKFLGPCLFTPGFYQWIVKLKNGFPL